MDEAQEHASNGGEDSSSNSEDSSIYSENNLNEEEKTKYDLLKET